MTRFTLVLLMVGACGGGSTDIEGTIVFADLPDAELTRMISAAGGNEMFGAQAQIDRFSGESDPCPAIAIDGSTITLTGGCTTADGVEVSGTARVTNPTSWDEVEYEYGDDVVYEMTAWTVSQGGYAQAFDGVMTISNFRTWDADVTATIQGLAVRSDVHYECSTSACELDGSGLELVGVGGALLSGSVDVEDRTQAYTLRGVDTLTVDVSATGCVAWQVSGSTREKVCAPQ